MAAGSRVGARVAAEAAALPDWAELLGQRSVDGGGAVEWRLRLRWSPTQDAGDVVYTLPEGYPFKPPDVRLAALDGRPGRLVRLPCCTSGWSPACQAPGVLAELAARLRASAEAHQRMAAEVEQLRVAPPPWLLHVGDLQVPAWLSEIDAAIADNVDLDPACPPGCSRHLRTAGHMLTLEDTRRVSAAQASAPSLGPWRLPLVVRAPEGSCYDHPLSRGIRVELTLGCGFPDQAPRLSVRSRMQHLLGASEMPLLFYETLAEECPEGGRGILASLCHLRRYLSEPLPGLVDRGLPHAPEVLGSEVLGRWHDTARSNLKRLEHIAAYAPHRLHPDLFSFRPGPAGLAAWRAAGLAEVLAAALESGSARSAVQEVAPGVFAFEMFTEAACDRLLAELENYERAARERGWPVARPNSMNNHGVILGEIGLEPWADALQRDVLGPVAAQLFPVTGSGLSEHHSFLVAYEPGADLGLDMHTDDSDVTFNVCLGKEFSGAGLVFCGQMGAADHRRLRHVYEHRKGRCVAHLGRHRHGADNILGGERRNLIIWNTSPSFRETRSFLEARPPFYLGYASEEAPPDKVCISRTWDRDALEVLGRDAPGLTVSSSAWCPPRGKEFAPP